MRFHPSIKWIFYFTASIVLFFSCKNLKTNSEDAKNKTDVDTNKYPLVGTVEYLSGEMHNIIPQNAKIELLAEGFNWSEGPVWLPKDQKLLFSDVPENKVFQWSENDGLSLYLKPSGYTGDTPRLGGKGSNGLAIDSNGNLILCQHGDRRVSMLKSLKDSLSPVFETVVSGYNGKRFNSPNDLVFDKSGNLYFTDPPYGLPKGVVSEIGFNGVYFYSKAGQLIAVDKTLERPNGIVVSHDGETLYVAESYVPKPIIWAYNIDKEGAVSNKRVFFNPGDIIKNSQFKQNPDGIKLDKDGNIFVAAADGILIITPQGKHIGTINLGRSTGNCEFTDDYKYLFITADNYLVRVELKQGL